MCSWDKVQSSISRGMLAQRASCLFILYNAWKLFEWRYLVNRVLLELGRNLNATWTIQKDCSKMNLHCGRLCVSVPPRACAVGNHHWVKVHLHVIYFGGNRNVSVSHLASYNPCLPRPLLYLLLKHKHTHLETNKRPIEHAFAEKINYCEILEKEISGWLSFSIRQKPTL